jgi:hypothetical protein
MKNFKSIATGLYLGCAIFGLTTGAANAGTIIGGSTLLTTGYVTQLENWLGEGPLALTNIFTKGITGSNSTDWHNAVNNQGRTFSVFEIVDNNQATLVIGGYNPQSWNSSGGYNFTPNDADRTAFIFNLTTGVVQRQCLSAGPINCGYDFADYGRYQTYNYTAYGPTFGGGHDI